MKLPASTGALKTGCTGALTVIMNEDQDRTRLGNAPENLAVLRYMATSCKKTRKKDHCAGKSNEPDGMTPNLTKLIGRF